MICNDVLLRFIQVVEKLIRGLAMEDSRNMFALFEHNNTIDRAVESRVLVADVLAKFERYVMHDHWLLKRKYCKREKNKGV